MRKNSKLSKYAVHEHQTMKCLLTNTVYFILFTIALQPHTCMLRVCCLHYIKIKTSYYAMTKKNPLMLIFVGPLKIKYFIPLCSMKYIKKHSGDIDVDISKKSRNRYLDIYIGNMWT